MSKVKVGDRAPDFNGETWEGQPVSLDDYRGKKVWLAFFRYASCPLCNLQVQRMRENHESLRSKGLEIVAIFQSPKAKMAKHVGTQNPEFPLIADPDESLYHLYSVGAGALAMMKPGVAPKLAKAMAAGYIPAAPDGTLSRIPADFLIDEKGVVIDRFDGKNIGDHIPFERVERFLD